MDPLICPICNELILDERLMCDGICGDSFHPACPRRATRSGPNTPFTCQTCTNIKPCHVLKAILLLNSTMKATTDKISDLEHGLSNTRSEMSLILSDRESMVSRLDGLQYGIEALSTVCSRVADITHRNLSSTTRLENTVVELSISPDISSLKDEISQISDRLSRYGRQLHSLTTSKTIDPRSDIPVLPPASPPRPSTSVTPVLTNQHTPSLHPSTPSQPNPPLLNGTFVTPVILQPNSPPPTPPPTISNPRPPSPHSLNPLVQPNQPTPPPLTPLPPISWIPNESLQSTSFYVGKCHPHTSEESIRAFISTELRVSASLVRCRKLISPSRPLTDYTFVSFKVNLPSTLAQVALSHPWPPNTRFTQFHSKPRPPLQHTSPTPTLLPSKNGSLPVDRSAT